MSTAISEPLNVKGREQHVMLRSSAGAQYVYSRVTRYYSNRIELKWKRAIHHCDACDIGSGTIPGVRGRGHHVPCGAIHYGKCTPVSFPFPQNYRKKSPISPLTPPPGTIPVAKVIPTRPVKVQPEVTNQKETDQVDSKKDVDEETNQNHVVHHTKDSKEILPRERELSSNENIIKERDKENKELSAPLSTAVPTITTVSISDSSKESKIKRKELVLSSKARHTSSANIPKFYFPQGKPLYAEDHDQILQLVSQAFSKLEGGKAYKQHLVGITKGLSYLYAPSHIQKSRVSLKSVSDQLILLTGDYLSVCKLPLYWKSLLFHGAGGEKNGFITLSSFTTMWKKVFQSCHDQASRFVKLLAKPATNYLEEDDLLPLIQDVVDTHPGLTFLQEAPEFHSRYVNTVISRTFYCVNRSWTGRITIPEIRKSNFLQTVERLEEEDDINQITDYFSYEHFYVIYCKFWELDKDHDLLVDMNDLSRHNDHAINSRVIDRIFSGCVTRGKTFKEGKMSYPEFVWFLLSEEDKKHPTSIEYWFRCMDLDGDGVISMYEMEYFYDEQVQKMEELGIEKLPFEDCLCQMLDLVGPKVQGQVTLADLKGCKMTNIFFDTFFNLDKFLEHEQRDPFSNIRDLDSDIPEPSDWEKYAAEEYENLVAEEGANEEILYEDDFEPDDDEIIQKERANLTDTLKQNSAMLRTRNVGGKMVNDDIYDFNKTDLGY